MPKKKHSYLYIAFFYCTSLFGAPQHIIDAHIHLFDPNKPGGIEWPLPDDPIYKPTLPADYKKVAEPLNISGAIVVECSFDINDNAWQLDLLKNDPSLYGFIGNITFGLSNFESDLNKFSADSKFLGIRTTPDINKQSHTDNLNKLVQKGLVLELWYGNDLFTLAKTIAQKWPDLPIIIDHAGNVTADGKPLNPATISFINSAASYPNIYCKVSSLFKLSRKNPAPIDIACYKPLLDALYTAFGSNRLIFGSDWPALELNGRKLADELNIMISYFSSKGDSVLQRVMWKNAIDFYHLPLSFASTSRPHQFTTSPPERNFQIIHNYSPFTIGVQSTGNETVNYSFYQLNGKKFPFVFYTKQEP